MSKKNEEGEVTHKITADFILDLYAEAKKKRGKNREEAMEKVRFLSTKLGQFLVTKKKMTNKELLYLVKQASRAKGTARILEAAAGKFFPKKAPTPKPVTPAVQPKAPTPVSNALASPNLTQREKMLLKFRMGANKPSPTARILQPAVGKRQLAL